MKSLDKTFIRMAVIGATVLALNRILAQESASGEELENTKQRAAKASDPSARPSTNADTKGGGGFGGGGGGFGLGGMGGGLRVGGLGGGTGAMYDVLNVLGSGEHRDRALVIRTSQMAREKVAALEEDLPVMSRILDKALERKAGDEESLSAMNIRLTTLPVGQKSRAIYLEGYGVLFLQQVRFPLVAPPKGSEELKTKAKEDSTWDQTRRELYGSPDHQGDVMVLAGQPDNAEPYDAVKVSRLEAALIEALKNAANIRELKSEDAITVLVSGARPNPTTLRASTSSGELFDVTMTDAAGGQNVIVTTLAPGGARHKPLKLSLNEMVRGRPESMLTIRVRKADVDAYAKGTLSSEEFHKKVSLLAY